MSVLPSETQIEIGIKGRERDKLTQMNNNRRREEDEQRTSTDRVDLRLRAGYVGNILHVATNVRSVKRLLIKTGHKENKNIMTEITENLI